MVFLILNQQKLLFTVLTGQYPYQIDLLVTFKDSIVNGSEAQWVLFISNNWKFCYIFDNYNSKFVMCQLFLEPMKKPLLNRNCSLFVSKKQLLAILSYSIMQM